MQLDEKLFQVWDLFFSSSVVQNRNIFFHVWKIKQKFFFHMNQNISLKF